MSDAGRPSLFSQELADRICEQISEGRSLRRICEEAWAPNVSTIIRWLANPRYDEFCAQYARAKEAQADFLQEEIIEICDDGRNDWMERRSEAEKGAGVNNGWVLNGEHVQRSKLRVDSRFRLMAQLAPKKYAEKRLVTNDTNVNVALTILPSPISRIAADVEQVARRRADGALQADGADGFVLLAAPSAEEK